MNKDSLLSEYVAWLIRNSYKDSGLNGHKFDCDIFSVLINPFHFDVGVIDIPDSIAGFSVFCDDQLSSEFIARLILKPENYSKDASRFLKAFYNLQSIYGFYYNDTWKKELGVQ